MGAERRADLVAPRAGGGAGTVSRAPDRGRAWLAGCSAGISSVPGSVQLAFDLLPSGVWSPEYFLLFRELPLGREPTLQKGR